MVRTLLIVAAAGIVLSVVTLGGAVVLAGPEIRNGWSFDGTHWDDDDYDRDAGPSVERTLEWTGGDALIVSLPAEVVFAQSAEASVRVTGPEDVVNRLTLVDGRLDLESEDGGWVGVSRGADRLRIAITAPDVSRFVLEGSGDLDLRALDLPALRIEVSGSGDVDAAGRADSLDVVVQGSGEAALDDVSVQSAAIRIDGSGDVSADPAASANVTINGSGDVSLRSRPAQLEQTINGSGDVRISSGD